MRGLDPRIHPFAKKMDGRIKSGHDQQNGEVLGESD
jgi:hypothetical protein